jgi:hypothetical protein
MLLESGILSHATHNTLGVTPMPSAYHRIFYTSHVVATALALASGTVDAKPWAAWLIDPASNNGIAIEILDDPAMKEGIWRLVTREGMELTRLAGAKVPKGYSLNLGQCQIDGTLRHDFVAIVKHSSRNQWSSNVYSAWKADPNAKLFAPMETKGMVCLNEGFGL